MKRAENTAGRRELRETRNQHRALFLGVLLFSIFVNLLMLTGPIFMLQVYDRVLSSRSEATLAALMMLVVFLYLAMGFLDYARGRVTARIGARFQDRLDRRVFSAALSRNAARPNDPLALAAQRDLEAIQRLLSSPTLLAFFDLPWTPIFIFAIFIFHPWLGWLAVAGGGLLVIAALLHQRLTREPMAQANAASARAERLAEQIKDEADLVRGLGMRGHGFARWQAARRRALGDTIALSDRSGGFTAFSKAFRLFLQSAMLGLGAYLVLQNQLTPGAMIAGSILLGRALAPVDQSISQWGVMQRAQEGWARLGELLTAEPPQRHPTPLPRPRALLEAQGLTVVPPGERQASLRMLSFRLEPGQALGVIGSSGAGKSTLARALIGVWPAASGKVRLDGAALDQYDPDVLGALIGYLPQQVTLFDGTIAENIARLSPRPDPEAVVRAAKRAGAHDLIVTLPQGYDTPVSQHGSKLSGGQTQRIGLARAMYGDPVILVLDEPNANLDNTGSAALNAAIRETKAAGNSVLIMAHRPAAIQECDMLLVLEGGMRKAFGPRDEVLRETVRNHTDILRNAGPGGVS
ncbi:type I secretion system permease/ATPase [Alkalilacustris brevis]|uniref:type I secretion system permease/ATPase n=1 Tax=Alkalilacustris brevis TaxID=2026338 RepID=UPI000E0D8AB3|nr:type I secretion system permease/ATPase [Alkalilacustris brevis]